MSGFTARLRSGLKAGLTLMKTACEKIRTGMAEMKAGMADLVMTGPPGLSPRKIGEDIAKETAKYWKCL